MNCWMDFIRQLQIPTLMITFPVSRLMGTFLALTRQSAGRLKSSNITPARAFSAGRGWRYLVLSRNLESVSGLDVVWFDEVLTNARLGKCRGTGVVVKENGNWKIAQYSLTLLIPNDIAVSVGTQSMQADALVAPSL